MSKGSSDLGWLYCLKECFLMWEIMMEEALLQASQAQMCRTK